MKGSLRKFAVAAAASAALAGAMPAQAGEAEDMAAIVNLMNRYGAVHDFGTPEDYASLFTREGEIAVGEMVLVKGTEALRAQAVRDHERFTIELPDGGHDFLMRHLISNTVIDSLDGDSATGTSFVTTMIRDGENGPRILSIGRYVDRYAREDGEWKIARRTIVTDFGNPELGRKYGFTR